MTVARGRRTASGAVVAALVGVGVSVAVPAVARPLSDGPPARITFDDRMGGIPVHISAWGMGQGDLDALRPVAAARLDALERVLSTYRPDSLVNRIGRGEVRAVDDPDLRSILATAAEVARRSGGAFDITVRPLVDLWRRARTEDRAPDDDAIAAARARVGWRRLGPDGDNVAALIESDGGIDPGGIAKGYMADALLDLLHERGAARAMVEIGGDLAGRDDARSAPFRVGIRHPLHEGRLLGVLEIEGGAVVTSGNYERAVVIAGRRYGHILDPRTGRPTAEDPLSVTVAAADGARADAWATALYVLGIDEGSRVAAERGLDAIFVARDSEGKGLRIVATNPAILRRLQLRDPSATVDPGPPRTRTDGTAP